MLCTRFNFELRALLFFKLCRIIGTGGVFMDTFFRYWLLDFKTGVVFYKICYTEKNKMYTCVEVMIKFFSNAGCPVKLDTLKFIVILMFFVILSIQTSI
jgi:hypothetical protein